jgi:methionyl-tRNA formyltransferase
MKFVVFASDYVGKEVVKIFEQANHPICGLILDAKDKGNFNKEIIDIFSRQNFNSPILYSDAVYDQESLLMIQNINPDLMLLAWWSYIIKPSLIQIPRLGVLNFHPSYLPHNRGKHYNFWTLVEETPFGVTIHWVDEGVDSGEIAFQELIEKDWEDTGETLYYKAQEKILKLFKDNFETIRKGEIPRTPQDFAQGSFHKASELAEASHIDLDKEYQAKDLLNLLRAKTFPPHPAAWFIDEDGNKFEVCVKISRCDKE